MFCKCMERSGISRELPIGFDDKESTIGNMALNWNLIIGNSIKHLSWLLMT